MRSIRVAGISSIFTNPRTAEQEECERNRDEIYPHWATIERPLDTRCFLLGQCQHRVVDFAQSRRLMAL
jgi:hypothetical protein